MLDKKYRPDNFKDFAGNEEIVSVLKAHIESKEHPHVYLFSGASGCGKTTLARILANGMGIREKVNYVEINAASARGIDTIREIQEEMNILPLIDPCKFYVFDESHKLTGDAQPALLKLTEDVPEHVYFVFCTTEPSGMIKALINRCTHLKVKPLERDELKKVIVHVNDKEEKLYILSDEVLNLIIDKSEGSSKIALNLLEKIIDLKDEATRIKVIEDHYNEETDEDIIVLCRKLVNGTWPELLEVYKNINIIDPERIRRICLGYLHSCLMSSRSANDVEKFAVLIYELKDNIIDSSKAGLLGAFARAKIILTKKGLK